MLRQSTSCRLDRIMKLIKYTHWISLERSEKNKQDMCKTYLPPKASTLYKFTSASRHFVSSWQDFHTCSCLLRCIKSPFFRKKLWSGERSMWSLTKDIWKSTKETLLRVILIKCSILSPMPCLLRKRHDRELGRILNLNVCETATPPTAKLPLLLRSQLKSLLHFYLWELKKVFGLMCFFCFCHWLRKYLLP